MNLGVLSVFLSCAVASSLAAAVTDICHGLDCPKYTVLNSTDKWELRRYEATKWVATNDTQFLKEQSNSQMFFKLFAYISGANSQGVKIDMTAPVLTKVIHGQGPNCRSTFVQHFMLTHKLWAAPIPPTDASVYIVDIPQMDVFVRQFGGYAEATDYTYNVRTLAADLTDDGYSVDDSFYYEAGYDGPYSFTARHNEVWLLRK